MVNDIHHMPRKHLFNSPQNAWFGPNLVSNGSVLPLVASAPNAVQYELCKKVLQESNSKQIVMNWKNQ